MQTDLEMGLKLKVAFVMAAFISPEPLAGLHLFNKNIYCQVLNNGRKKKRAREAQMEEEKKDE